MKRSLAKLILGTDVREDYSDAEHEYLAAKSKTEKKTDDVKLLNAQKEKLEKDIEAANSKLTSLQQQIRSIDEAIQQRLGNAQDTDIKGRLQKLLELKIADLTLKEEELEKVKRQQNTLKDKEQTATQNKQSLEDDIASLNKEITDLRKQVKERNDKKQEAIKKLPQKREILNHLKSLKEQWDEKLNYFQELSDSNDKATLQNLKKELDDYYKIIDNATKAPTE